MFGQVKRVAHAAVCTLPVSIMLGVFGLSSASAQTRIAPGDKLAVTVYNHPDITSQLTVTSIGDVRVPVAGNVAVEGLSEQAATSKIRTALRPYLFNPSVDVRVVAQGQSIFFTGSLVGVQQYSPGETLVAAVSAFRQVAGSGAAATASANSIDLRYVRVERGQRTLAPVDLEALARSGDAGPRLEPGDVVLLRAKPIRVDVRGNLSTPTAVYVYPGDTLSQAVAEVGPYTSTTSLSSIGLRRGGVDSTVSAAGAEFKAPAQDGDLVTLEPAPRVSILGMVEKPGDQTLQTRPSLLNALYEAGGPNRYADLSHIKVTHQGATREYSVAKLTHGDLSQDAPVEDGDVIFVPEGHRIDLSTFSTALGALTTLSVFRTVPK